MLALDWGGGGCAGGVVRSRLVTDTNFSPTALSSLVTPPCRQYSDVDLFPPCSDEALLYLL
jgi:hypothetical protein